MGVKKKVEGMIEIRIRATNREEIREKRGQKLEHHLAVAGEETEKRVSGRTPFIGWRGVLKGDKNCLHRGKRGMATKFTQWNTFEWGNCLEKSVRG